MSLIESWTLVLVFVLPVIVMCVSVLRSGEGVGVIITTKTKKVVR